MYPSPFRTYNKPSYSVSIRKNISYNFASIEARDLVGSIAHHYGLSVSQALKKLEELLRMYPTAEYTSSFTQKVPFNEVYDKKRISPHAENQNAGEGPRVGDTEITEILEEIKNHHMHEFRSTAINKYFPSPTTANHFQQVAY